VIGIFAVWANRLLFNPNNWSNTSTQLLQHPAVRSSTANYLVDQLYANVDVAGLLKSDLPAQLQPLAAPAAGALRNAAVNGADAALTRPRVQSLWAQANRVADQSFIDVVKGGRGPVGTEQGAVTLDLASIVNNIAGRLGLPANIAAKLPPNVAQLTVLKSDQLKLIQDGGNAIQGLALWLTILTPLLFALAIVVARGHRRRTLMTVGFACAFAGVAVLLGRSLLQSQLPGSLTSDASLKPTITAVASISTQILADVAGAVIVVGLVLVAAAAFAGPSRVASSVRRAIAPFLREHPGAAFAITLALMALIFIWKPIPAAGKPAGIIVFTLLALLGTELLRRQTAAEFPGAQAGETRDAIRDLMRSSRERRAAKAPPPPPVTTTVEQLAQLAQLRDHGAITPAEYQTAKSQLLRS
jgi:Short C-terminal domain